MSADSSSNTTPISQTRRDRQGDTNGRSARAAAEVLAGLGGGKPEAQGRSGQSRRPFNRDRDSDPSGKNLPLNKAASLLGYEAGDDDTNSKSSGRKDRSRKPDDSKRDGDGANRAASGGQDDDARNRANRPALELDDDDLGPAERKAKQSKAKTVADYATEIGADPKELYELSVAFDDDDEPMTIGAMKDRIKEVRDFERRRDDFEDHRTESMNEILSARQQIDGVMQRVMQTIPREQLEQHFGDYIQQHQKRVGEARKQLREFFPEWDDANVAAKDREELDACLTTYGFTTHEIDNLQDARLIRFAVHAMRMMGRYKRVKEQLAQSRDKVPTTAPASRRPVRSDPASSAKALAAKGDKLGAISSLISR